MRAMVYQKVRTRDTIDLATDVWLPDGPGPWPTVLIRTPYHRQGGSGRGKRLTDLGYAFVIQDTRGKYDSEGVFRPLDDEAADGHDTIDWIANQTWSNGRVGMIGASYLGIVQIPAASGGHAALRCILPGVAPGSYFRDWVRYDGCFALANMVRWPFDHSICPTKPHSGHFTWEELWRLGARSTLDELEERVGFSSAQLRNWVARDCYDDYWESIDQERMYERVSCPGMHQAGFFDHISRGQFNAFGEIRERGATASAREQQYLLVGPWGHGGCNLTSYGDWEFGPSAGMNIDAYQQRFLDLWLKDIDDGISEVPPVRYFLMGANRWEHADTWPPSGAELQSWHLGSTAGARGLGGGGRLTRETPSGADADSYTYDPHDPVPTLGGQVYWGMRDVAGVGPVDQHPILRRADVLYYRSPVLSRPLTVVGGVGLELWVTSNAPDTDFIAKLCVVEPFGQVTALTLGSIRCRYRDSWREPKPLPSGEPVRLNLQMNNVAYTFPCGSRIALVVTSSCSPRILPSRNTMAPTWQETAHCRAHQEVLHVRGHESRLLLPVLGE